MITNTQINTFEQEGAVTIDTPLTDDQLTQTAQLMDTLLPLGPPRPGEKKPRYRVGENSLLQPSFVSIIANPFFEEVMKKLLYTDNVVITNTAIRKTHPQPNAKFEIGEHTDITYGLADMASKPRRMDLGLFIWIKDVGPKTAPLMYRPKSHLQIAQWMDDRPTYLTKSTDINNYVNMQDTHSRPAGHAKHPDDWPDLEFEDPIPVVGHAGQVSVVNQAAIHGASTNVDTKPRYSFFIGFRPRDVVMGEAKSRFNGRRSYLPKLREVLPPDRHHLIPDDVQ